MKRTNGLCKQQVKLALWVHFCMHLVPKIKKKNLSLFVRILTTNYCFLQFKKLKFTLPYGKGSCPCHKMRAFGL